MGPLLVDVLLLLIDDLGAVLVDVRLLAGLLVQQVDFIPESGEVEVPLQPLVLALQRLDSAEIMAHAVVVEGLCLVLLRDPFLGLVPVPVEHLHLMSTLEGGAPCSLDTSCSLVYFWLRSSSCAWIFMASLWPSIFIIFSLSVLSSF